MRKAERRNLWIFGILSIIIAIVLDFLIEMPTLSIIAIMSSIFLGIFLIVLLLTDKKLQTIDTFKIHNSTEREYYQRYIIFLKRMYHICKTSIILTFMPLILTVISKLFDNEIILCINKYLIFYFISFIILDIFILVKRIIEVSREDFKRIGNKISNTKFD